MATFPAESSNDSSSLSGDSEYRIVQANTIQEDSAPKIMLSWENISYTVKSKLGTEQILKDLSGFANPGEILAIMGSSGAGKTTLLNVLAGRTRSSDRQVLSGGIYANGVSISDVPFGDHAAYVTQTDILLPVLTPMEAVSFSAKLRCRETDVTGRVQKILSDLKLTSIAHNKIGSVEIKGISGGERKRVSIAVELVTEPSVLFLDEPTSGLDVHTAEVLVKLLAKQTEKGRTIITTIHQPSDSIFNKFHRLILMSEGHFVYQGNAKKAVDHFNGLGFECPKEISPPDHFMKVLHVKNRRKQTPEDSEKLKKFISSYKEAQVYSEQKLEDLSDPRKLDQGFSKNLLFQTKELFVRSWKNSTRDPALSFVKIAQSLALSILSILIFNQMDTDLEGVQTRTGFLFFTTINQVMLSLQTSNLSCKFYLVPTEKPVLIKEHKQGMYGSMIYYLTKSLTDVPMMIVSSVLQTLIMYWVVGLQNEPDKVFIFCKFYLVAALILMQFSGCGYGYLVGALSNSVDIAITLAPMIVTPFLMFGGYFSNEDSLPEAFAWVRFLSVIHN